MAGQKRAVFELDDDEDSVATDSTAESVEAAEYEVEKILLEQYDPDIQEMKYLVKWSGYALHRSTFEVADNFMSDEILEEWKHQKDLIEQGKVDGFDIQEFVDVYSRHQELKAERQRRRDAKREKRRRCTLAAFQLIDTTNQQEGDDDDDDEDEISIASPWSKALPSASTRQRSSKMKRQPLKPRKGIARKVHQQIVISSDDNDRSDEEGELGPSGNSSTAESTLETGQNRAPGQKLARTTIPSSSSADKTNPTKPLLRRGATNSKPSLMQKPVTSISKPTKPPLESTGTTAEQGRRRTSQVAQHASVPSVMANWEADRRRDKKSRVIKRRSTDANNTLFQKLSVQNGFQKHNRKEPAPDVNSLVMIDPKTGKPESIGSNKTHPAVPTSGAPSDSYRRTPPRPRRARSISPAPNRSRVTENSTDRASSDQRSTESSKIHGAGKRFVCEYWDRGECRYTEEECPFAHHYIDQSRPPAKPVTCHFWREGYCKKSETECTFAHHDTGVYAAAPKGSTSKMTCSSGKSGDCRKTDCENTQFDTGIYAAASKESSHQGTCFFWKNGGCKFTDCAFAHYDTAYVQTLPTKKLTCRYWKRGRCTKTEETCQYAHHDAGQDTSEPTSGRKDVNSANAPSAHPGQRSVTLDNVPSRLSSHDLRLQTDVPRTQGPTSSIAIETSPMDIAEVAKPGQKRTAPPVVQPLPRRSNSVPNIINDGELRIRPKGVKEAWALKARFESSDLTSFTQLVGSSPLVHVDSTIMAADVCMMDFETSEGVFQLQVSGDMTFGADSFAQADSLARTCKIHSCGLMASVKAPNSRMLMFPSNTEEWKFLDTTKGQGHSTGAMFRFKVFQCPRDFHVLAEHPPSVPIPTINEARLSLTQVLDTLDVKRFFHSDDKRGMDRAVFLMIPPEHRDELDVYIKFFGALKSKVYCSETPGAWSYVREHHRKNCLLIVHPDIPLWQVPGLYNFITLTGAGLRIFSMGVHKSQAILEGRQARFECLRLFPHGTVYFITDEVFLHQPESATQIIMQYLEQHKNKPEGGENDRIATRPGVKQWLLQVAEKNTVGRDDRWINLWSAICQLCPLEDEDPRDPPNPLPTSNLISVPPEVMPRFQALLQQQHVDEFAPTDWMVNWFAGWGLCHVMEFRRFIVVHAARQVAVSTKVVMDENGRMYDCPEPVEADPRGWAAKYQHIGVMRPESCIRRKK